MTEVKRYADKILQLDPESAYGNVYKAWVVWTDQRAQESFLLLGLPLLRQLDIKDIITRLDIY